jgi:hypothetical protein
VNAPRFGALVAVMALLFGVAPSAAAQPVSDVGAPVDSPTLALTDLGTPNDVAFRFSGNWDNAASTLTVPVPQGMAPVALNAMIEVPISLRYASLAVTQDGRTISRLGLPLVDQSPVVIPLAGAEVVGNSMTVTLTMTVLPLEEYCWDPLAPVRLANGSVTYSGAEVAPITVAGFLPPVLRALTIALPAKPSRAESSAAVQLAGAIESRYGAQNPDVVFVPLADGSTALPGPTAPLERRIIVKEGPDKGLSLQPATGESALLISGSGDELANQTRLLADEMLQYALSPNTVVTGPLPNTQQPLGDTVTLAQLNQTGLHAEALLPEVAITIDATRFGHLLSGVRVHLLGSYTPLPSNFGGEVTASIGGETIDRWPAEASGTIDRWVDIPDQLVSRVTGLTVAVNVAGDAGPCGHFVPISLKIDDSTEIQSKDANSPSVLGFSALPQALMPRIQIGIGDDAFGDTVRAARIVTGLQHMSAVPLDTTVTSLNEAINSDDPAVLISAGAWPAATITAPFTADQNNVTVRGVDSAGKPVTLTLDPTTRFGSLQTAFDGQRAVLVATSNEAPEQLDELLGWLSDDTERWFGLTGQAVFSTPGNDPITVSNPSVGVAALPTPSTSGIGATWRWWLAGGLAGVAAVAAVGGLIVFLAARRRRSQPESNPSRHGS